jgi:hypothetical protein
MSHFSVVVVGEDVDGQLAPYSEQDYDERYATFEDMTGEIEEGWKQYPLDLLADGGSDVEYKTIEEYAEGHHGYKKNDEGNYGYEHNPNAQWDWWEVGGRWNGFFTSKTTGESVNQIAVKDLAVESERGNAEAEARKAFAVWRAIFHHLGQPRSWAECRDSNQTDIDAARKVYNAQEAIKAYKKVDDWNCPVALLGFDEDDYVARMRDQVFVPYAVVKDGKWVGKGQMGWFGTSHDDASEGEWCHSVQELLMDLDPDTLLTVVDCHI